MSSPPGGLLWCWWVECCLILHKINTLMLIVVFERYIFEMKYNITNIVEYILILAHMGEKFVLQV